MIEMELDFVLRAIMDIVDEDRSLSHEDFVKQFGPNPLMASAEQLTDFMETFANQLATVDWSDPNVERNIEYLIPRPFQWRMLEEMTMGRPPPLEAD
jgi:hypothetical protein